MNKSKGAVIPAKSGIRKTIVDLLEKAVDTGFFDAVIIPMRAPAGDSF